LLALVPGFPSITFIGIAVGAFLLARYSMSNARKADGDEPNAFAPSVATSEAAIEAKNAERASLAQPLSVELCVAEGQQLDVAAIRAAIAQTVAASAGALGIRMPAPTIVPVRQTSSPAWRILIFDVPMAAAAADAALEVDELQRALATVLARHAERFVGVQEVSNLLESAGEQYPALVKEVLRQLPPQKIAEVLRHLLREDVPVRNLRDVLEALAEWGSREKDAGGLAEFVRVHLKSYMTSRFTDAERKLKALVLDGAAEDLIRRALTDTPAGMMLTLPPERISELRESLRTELQRLETSAPQNAAAGAPILIANIDVRRHVRTMLAAMCPSLAVLSYQELLPDVELQPLGAVRFQTEIS
jgi:type III secretion protein V